jgi:hypothetical protein
MKIVVVALAAASLIAGAACEVSAADYLKAHRRHAQKHYYRHVAHDHGYKQAYPDASGWFPHDSNELQFGSALWWDQMRREGRVKK